MKKVSAVIASLMFATQLQAATINSASDPALAGGIAIDFEGLPVGAIANGNVLNLGAISIVNERNQLNVHDKSFKSYAGIGTGALVYPAEIGNRFIRYYNDTYQTGASTWNSDPLKVIFNQSAKAFGFNYANDCSGMSIVAYNMLDQVLDSTSVGFRLDLTSFVGLSTSEDIAYVLIQELGQGSAISTGYMDNFRLAPSSVPVPASLPLLATAMAGYRLFRRKIVGLAA